MSPELIKAVSSELSRVLRYSYGGVLLVALTYVVNPHFAKGVVESIGSPLAAIATVVLGAGIYAAHRSFVIPIHHVLLCIVFHATKPLTKSTSPTEWLNRTLKIQPCQRIMAYSALRRSSDFLGDEQKTTFNVAHAESGLVVMTAEGFLVAAIYLCSVPSPPVSPGTFFWLSIFFLIASFPGAWQQHAAECLQWSTSQMEAKARTVLTDQGLLKESPPPSSSWIFSIP